MTDNPYLRQIYPINVCVNDERGHQTGRIIGLCIQSCGSRDIVLEFECVEHNPDRQPRFRYKCGGRSFRVDDREFGFEEHHQYSGNLMWDFYGITGNTLIDLLAFIKVRAEFTLEGGWSSISEAYETGVFGSEQLKEIFLG